MKSASSMRIAARKPAMWLSSRRWPCAKSYSLSVLPKPSQSGAMTRKCSAKAPMLCSHDSSAQPPNSPLCSSTSVGPRPASR